MVASMGAALTVGGWTSPAQFHIRPTQKKLHSRTAMPFLMRSQSLDLHVAVSVKPVTPVSTKRSGALVLDHSASTASDAA